MTENNNQNNNQISVQGVAQSVPQNVTQATDQVPTQASNISLDKIDSPIQTMQDHLDLIAGKPFVPEKEIAEVQTAPVQGATGRIMDPSYFLQSAQDQAATHAYSTNNTPAQAGSQSPFLANVPSASVASQSANMPLNKGKSQKDGQSVPVSGGIVKWKSVIIVLAAALIILALGLVGYWYWVTSSQAVQVEQPVNEEPISQEPQAEVPVQPEPKFSSNNPNYLSIDANSLTASSVKDVLKTKLGEVRGEGINVPVEFIVTDLQNNPIDFHIFAALAGMKIDPAVLDTLDIKFSVFLYQDQGMDRIGVAVASKDKLKTQEQLKLSEAKFLDYFSVMFLGESYVAGTVKFNDSVYGSFNIRYYNVNAEKTLSLDYTFKDNELIIATSKDTLRSILDKKAQMGARPSDENKNDYSLGNQSGNSERSEIEINNTKVSGESLRAQIIKPF